MSAKLLDMQTILNDNERLIACGEGGFLDAGVLKKATDIYCAIARFSPDAIRAHARAPMTIVATGEVEVLPYDGR